MKTTPILLVTLFIFLFSVTGGFALTLRIPYAQVTLLVADGWTYEVATDVITITSADHSASIYYTFMNVPDGVYLRDWVVEEGEKFLRKTLDREVKLNEPSSLGWNGMSGLQTTGPTSWDLKVLVYFLYTPNGRLMGQYTVFDGDAGRFNGDVEKMMQGVYQDPKK